MTDSPAARILALRTADFARKITSRAADLRDLADALDRVAAEVAQVGTKRPGAPYADNFTYLAHDVQRQVSNVVYNLVLHTLTVDAFQLDELRATVKAATADQS